MRSRAPWFLVAGGLVLVVPTLALAIRNGSLSEDALSILLALAMTAGWATVGALLASRNPSNPIGWLMMAFGLGFLLSGLMDELSTYGYETNPGGLPLRTLWPWIGSWIFIAVLTPIPILLLLYPTGAAPSRRWRPLLWTLIGAAALAIAATVLRTDTIYAGEAQIPNPTGVPSLQGAAEVVQNVVGFGYIGALVPLCILALVLRFRRSRGVERQQIRWLAYVSLISGVALAVAIASSIGLESDETNVVTEVSFYVFFLAMGLGIPAAIGVALLRHRLWDLDVVLKKALVAAILVVLITIASLVALVLAGAILVDPLNESPTLALVIGLAIGALAWPLLRLAAPDRGPFGLRWPGDAV